ncbi:carboxyl transferase [Phakopsora pachyrhizi]|nr:carboxyl transferase [Phakopsora pachyrhizi]
MRTILRSNRQPHLNQSKLLKRKFQDKSTGGNTSIRTYHHHHHHHHHQTTIQSTIDPNSTQFRSNLDSNSSLIDQYQSIVEQRILPGGPERSRNKHLDQGKLLTRQRIQHLIDPFSPFLELSQAAGYGLYEGEDLPAGGIITGIGQIHGVNCMVIANDPTVKGGSYYPITVKKQLRAQEIALENRLPCIYLVESGGANLPNQSDVFPDKQHFGRIFYNQAQLSSRGIPQISVVHGISVAGGAYMPAMSDTNIIVKNQGRIFLAGPNLVKAAIGQDVDEENLGGGEMHCSISGVCDHLALNDQDAISIARNEISYLNLQPSSTTGTLLKDSGQSDLLLGKSWEEPIYDQEQLNGIVSSNLKQSFEIKEIIARLVDGSKFHEFKKEYGKTIVTGFAKIHGQTCGIIGNNGILFSPSSLKATHFIQLCEQRRIPLVFLVNVTGYMVGEAAERGGIAKDGSKMVRAVACTTVPKYTVIVGGSFGAGNYGMAGRAYGSRFLWMWPNSKVSVMGSEQLSHVMKSISKDTSKTEKLKRQIEVESEALYSSARLWDDGIIRPTDTRSILGLSLSLNNCNRQVVEDEQSRSKTSNFGVFRM